MVCPACHRDFAPGLRFCPHDARELVLASDPGARAAGAGATCPTCKRSYDAGKKFCPFDGEELVPLPLALGATSAAGDADHVGGWGKLGKICPNCSRRYESEATFCGRDGEELVSVN
jgi:predicted amidophosphoribosyltransferase